MRYAVAMETCLNSGMILHFQKYVFIGLPLEIIDEN